jgi:Fic family protein
MRIRPIFASASFVLWLYAFPMSFPSYPRIYAEIVLDACGEWGPRTRPLRGAGGRSRRRGHEGIPFLFQRAGRHRRCSQGGVSHLWFVTVHPFEDGNGRMARAIADLQLARSEGSPQRFYSMSAQISRERKVYYEILEATQKGYLDITGWITWFLACLSRAFDGAESILAGVLRKARFREKHAGEPLNERQRDMLNRLLDGFEGKLTSSKWAAIEKCSQDTALRDITDLLNRGILARDEGGGRSTSYSLVDG